MTRKLTAAFLALVSGSLGAQSAVGLPDGAISAHSPQSVITVPKVVDGDPGAPGLQLPNGPGVGYNDPLYQSPYGAHNGVVRLLMRDAAGNARSGCTGTLLWTGWDILTAAHCVHPSYVASVDVGFINSSGTLTNIGSTSIVKMAGYTGAVVDSRDLAIIRLEREADSWMTRHMLHTGPSLYQDLEFVGFGLTGNGETGGQFSTQFCDIQGCGTPVRRRGTNSWESTFDGSFLYNYEATNIYMSDFDSGSGYDLICALWGGSGITCDGGNGVEEVGVSNGDSGGGAFIGGRVAGVASFGFSACRPNAVGGDAPDDGCAPGEELVIGSFGEYFGMSGHVGVGGENGDWIHSTVTPEPGTVALLATGLIGLVGFSVRRRSSK